MKAYLTWNDENYGVQGFNVYRDTQPLDPQNLPAPLASLGPAARDYEDATVVDQTTYYYMVTALVDGQEPATANFEILAEEPDGVPTYETFNATSTGRDGTLQTFQVPNTGLFTIEAAGAKGGDGSGGGSPGGKGAKVIGTFSLTGGDTLNILVGQMDLEDPSAAGGGGGGTYVAVNGQPLIVAGGGGGGGADSGNGGMDAVVTEQGTLDSAGQGLLAAAGEGGYAGEVSGNDNGGGGGGGFYSDGQPHPNGSTGTNGQGFLNGGRGAKGGNSAEEGGFGGGGSTPLSLSNSNCSAGAGGGYTGGCGGSRGIAGSTRYGGGGGGSYNGGTDQDNQAGVNDGPGWVLIYNASGLAAQT